MRASFLDHLSLFLKYKLTGDADQVFQIFPAVGLHIAASHRSVPESRNSIQV